MRGSNIVRTATDARYRPKEHNIRAKLNAEPLAIHDVFQLVTDLQNLLGLPNSEISNSRPATARATPTNT
jgi:hypothetical protein